MSQLQLKKMHIIEVNPCGSIFELQDCYSSAHYICLHAAEG